MNTTPTSDSRRNGIIGAIGVLVLLLGTATGNAYAILTMAIVALVAIVIFFRQRLGRNVIFAMTAAAATAIGIAVAMTKM